MNEIEEALTKAFEHPENQDHFYQTLIDSVIIVLVPKNVSVKVDPDTNEVIGLELVRISGRDGVDWVPFFSSLEFIANLPENFQQMSKAKLKARQFFKIIHSTKAILNPNSELRKEFEPDEIQALLNGEVFASRGVRELDVDDTVTFLDPKEIPAEFVSGLKEHFKKTKDIKSGHVALRRSNSDNEIACMLLIETTAEKQGLINALGKVTAPMRRKYPYMDIIFEQDGDAAKEIRENGLQLKEKKTGFFSW